MKNLFKTLFPSKAPRTLAFKSKDQLLPYSGPEKRLYECKLEDLKGFNYHPVKYESFIEPRIVVLYDHRWYINMQRQDKTIVNINPHINALSEAYTMLGSIQEKFKDTFCLSVESPLYMDIYGEIAKGAMNSNLIALYDGTREMIEKGNITGPDFYRFFKDCLSGMHDVKLELV